MADTGLDNSTKNGQRIHGLSKHPLYDVWYHMKYRCYNTSHKGYSRYGGRDISVCKAWREGFIAFYTWAIKAGWQKGLQIDRINNDGNYKPNNCRFVTHKQNVRNSAVCIITKHTADKIKQEYRPNEVGYKRLGRKHGLSASGIRGIIKRGNWA